MKRLISVFVLSIVLTFVAAVSAYASEVPSSRSAITFSFAPIVKQVTPAVVNIYTKKIVHQRLSPLFEDPFFRQFFGNNLPPGFSRERLENSLGSGVIVRSDGLIVTSNHVIVDADQIRVVLSDRREYDAQLLTADEHSDLAVLKINPKGEKLPFIELKDSDDAEIGDLVLAIGNPFGVGQTVTSGIISAMSHTALASSDLDYYIQTDAAINPGNSGGALVTMDGKLVGINAAIYSQSGGNLGIGFAVPSNMVRVVLKAVDEGKKSLVRAWLGFEGQAITPELAASLSLPQVTGVLVKNVKAIGPGTEAGLKNGDVITAIDGRSVEDPEAFHYRVSTLALGHAAKLSVIRKSQVIELTINLKAPPEIPPRDKTSFHDENPFKGATVQNLSPAVVEELNFRGSEKGVVVSALEENSVAVNIGIEVGDIVIAVNKQKITSVEDLKKNLKTPAERWLISLDRGGGIVTVMVGG